MGRQCEHNFDDKIVVKTFLITRIKLLEKFLLLINIQFHLFYSNN